MAMIFRFERVEKKYLLGQAQYDAFLPRLLEYMQPDQYGDSVVSNVYLDSPDDLLVRRSIEKPRYKEKLRLRSYGVPDDDGTVFLEIKKKADGVVYKRRVGLTAAQAMAYLAEGAPMPRDGQIAREIDYMLRRYALIPKLYLAYNRVAYTELTPGAGGVRVTIDRDIRSRESDLDLRLGDAGKLLLPHGERLMEIKTEGAYPLWLASALCAAKIYPTSFSKYGSVYQKKMQSRSMLAPRHAMASRPREALGGWTHAYSPV